MKLFDERDRSNIVILICLLVTSSCSLSELKLASELSVKSHTKGLLKFASKQIIQTVQMPKNLPNMVLAYTTIYPDDSVSKITLDSIAYENGNIVIYRPEPDSETTKIYIDIKELSWLCGKSLLCKPEEAAEKFSKGQVSKRGFMKYVKELYKKLGPDSTNCVADQYMFGIIQKAIIICFKNNKKEAEFRNLFSMVDPKSMATGGLQTYDPKDTLTFLISFSDGREAFVEKNLTFKQKGVYEGKNLLFNYGDLENMGAKKCQIKYRLPIVPTNFVSKDIISRDCVARFKYNKVDTYAGTSSANCVNIMRYIITKMKAGCEEAKNGPSNSFKNDLRSNIPKGEWKGWVHYHKIIPEKGGEVTKLLHKLIVTGNKFSILDKDSHEVKVVTYNKLKWVCNNDGSCTIEEYKRYLKNKGLKDDFFKKLEKEMTQQWELVDRNSCFVIIEDDTHIICPTDNSEEFNMRLAISVGIDNFFINGPVENVPIPNDGSVFKVVMMSETDTTFKDYDAIVDIQGIKNKKDNAYLKEYREFTKLEKIDCGIEFRDFDLPYALHEYDSQCCMKYKTDELNYICIQKKSKCYLEVRQMIQLMRKNCLNVLKELNGGKLPSSDDDNNKISASKLDIQAYKGDVTYTQLGNYKYKGSAVSHKGQIDITSHKISFYKDKVEHLSFSPLEVRLICKSDFICKPDEYIRNQNKYHDDKEKDWMADHFSNFYSSNSDVKKADCAVLVTTNAEFNISEGVIVCSENDIEKIRAGITQSATNAISALIDGAPQLKKIPLAPNFSPFTAYIVQAGLTEDINKVTSNKAVIKVYFNGIRYKKSMDFVFTYKEIYNTKTYKVNAEFSIDEKKLAKDLVSKKLDHKCCFKIFSSANVFQICIAQSKKCVVEKAQLFRKIYEAAHALAMDDKKATEEAKANLKKASNLNENDLFEFGLVKKYREFAPDFSYAQLTEQTDIQIEKGSFKGWVFLGDLTNRDYLMKIKPVYIELADGIIDVRVDKEKKPHLTLQLSRYESLCSAPCTPNEYLRYAVTKLPIEEYVYLSKTLDNLMGQIFKPFADKACVVLDFMEAKYGYANSYVMCMIDHLQGEKLRQTLEVGVYNTFRKLDMKKEVRDISWNTEKFNAVIIENDNINGKYNEIYTTKTGIVGIKKGTKGEYSLKYGDIQGDNFGHQCAFWFKNMRIRERGKDFNDAVPDNNCCFRFYAHVTKKKIEICTFIPGSGNCIKKSRQLMKSIKAGCIANTEFGKLTEDPNSKKNKEDKFDDSTFDDNKNGIFSGFIYISDITKSNVLPNIIPQFIKIDKEHLDIYNDPDDPKPAFTINQSDIEYNCEEEAPCTPAQFKEAATNDKKLIPLLPTMEIVKNNFRERFPQVRQEFEKICFVLQTKGTSYLVCPYKSSFTHSLKTTLIESHKLSYNCKLLNQVENSKPGETFNIVTQSDKPKTSAKVKITDRGLMNVKDKSMVLEFLHMGKDPVTNKNCAIWFKDLKIPFEFEHKECCFTMSVNSKPFHICVEKKGVCVKTAFGLMKSIWNGCLFGITNLPKKNSSGGPGKSQILGDIKPFVPKTAYKYDPKSMFYDVLSGTRKTPIFKGELANDYIIDAHNRHIFSVSKTSFQGYFNVYPITFESIEPFQVKALYGVLHGEYMRFYKSKFDINPEIEIRPDYLSMSCSPGAACLPSEFGKYLSAFDPVKGAVITRKIVTKIMMFESNSENGCAMLENTIKNKPIYYMICIHVTNVKTENMGTELEIERKNYTAARNEISAQYGKPLRKILYDSYQIARKFVDQLALPVQLEDVLSGKITTSKGVESINNIRITSQGVEASGVLVFKFADAVHCRVRTNPVFVPKNVRSEKNKFNRACCMRFMGSENREYFCAETFNCEFTIFYFARQFNERCSAKRGRHYDDVYNEFNATPFKLIPILKKFIPTPLNVIDLENINTGSDALSADNFKTKFKTLAVKYLYEMKILYHDIAVTSITKSAKMNKNPKDTTPIDDPKMPPKDLKKLYVGKSENFNLFVHKGRVMSYKEIKGDRKAVSHNHQIALIGKFYSGIVFDNSKSAVLAFYNKGEKYFFEIDDSGKNSLTTQFEKLSQKSQNAVIMMKEIKGDIRDLEKPKDS